VYEGVFSDDNCDCAMLFDRKDMVDGAEFRIKYVLDQQGSHEILVGRWEGRDRFVAKGLRVDGPKGLLAVTPGLQIFVFSGTRCSADLAVGASKEDFQINRAEPGKNSDGSSHVELVC
jgi:hypothetical protein